MDYSVFLLVRFGRRLGRDCDSADSSNDFANPYTAVGEIDDPGL